jgi:hypothetical protein
MKPRKPIKKVSAKLANKKGLLDGQEVKLFTIDI